MKSLSKKFIYTTFIFALIILLFISYLTYKSIDAHFSDEQLITQSLLCTQTAESLMGNLSDASADRRAYLITSDTNFLNEYNESKNDVDSLFLNLRQMTNNNPLQKQYMEDRKSVV
jgi:CHASE3 domain sensor protein